MWVLLTGMSGTGKSTLVAELRGRGYTALDADDDGFSEPRADGRWGWGWRADRVATLLAEPRDGPAFFVGCSEEQAPLLRRSADLVLTTTLPPPELADALLRICSEPGGVDLSGVQAP